MLNSYGSLDPEIVAQRIEQRNLLFANNDHERRNVSEANKLIKTINESYGHPELDYITSTSYSYWCIADSIKSLSEKQKEMDTPTIVDTIHVIEKETMRELENKGKMFWKWNQLNEIKDVSADSSHVNSNELSAFGKNNEKFYSISLTETKLPLPNLFFGLHVFKFLLEVKKQRDFYTIQAISNTPISPSLSAATAATTAASNNTESTNEQATGSKNTPVPSDKNNKNNNASESSNSSQQAHKHDQNFVFNAENIDTSLLQHINTQMFASVSRRPLLEYFKIYGVNMIPDKQDAAAATAAFNSKFGNLETKDFRDTLARQTDEKSELVQMMNNMMSLFHTGMNNSVPVEQMSKNQILDNYCTANNNKVQNKIPDVNSFFTYSTIQLSLVRVYLECLVSFCRSTLPSIKREELNSSSNSTERMDCSSEDDALSSMNNVHLLEYSYCNTSYILPLLSRTMKALVDMLPLFSAEASANSANKPQRGYGVSLTEETDATYVVDPFLEIKGISKSVSEDIRNNIGMARVLSRAYRMLLFETVAFMAAFDVCVYTNTPVVVENQTPRLHAGAQSSRTVMQSPKSPGESSPSHAGQGPTQVVDDSAVEKDSNYGLLSSVYCCNLIFVHKQCFELLQKAVSSNQRALEVFRRYSNILSCIVNGRTNTESENNAESIVSSVSKYVARARCVKVLGKARAEDDAYAKYRVDAELETNADKQMHAVLNERVKMIQDVKSVLVETVIGRENNIAIAFNNVNSKNLARHLSGLLQLYSLSAAFEFVDRVQVEKSFNLKSKNQRGNSKSIMNTSGLSDLLKAPYICLHRFIFRQLDDNNLPFACTFYPSEEYNRILVEQTEYDEGMIDVYLGWVG